MGAAVGRASTRAGAAPQMSTNPDAPIKLGINGFGRIGRQVARIAMDRKDFVVKHINSPMSPEYMKYLLEHDTFHGLRWHRGANGEWAEDQRTSRHPLGHA